MNNDAAGALRIDDDGYGPELPELAVLPVEDDFARARERRVAERAAQRGSAVPRTVRSAPGRSYGSHGRTDVRGAQPGRRTVEITGYATPPRRRTHPAVTTHPDRVALYAVLLGLFLVVMAVVTAHG